LYKRGVIPLRRLGGWMPIGIVLSILWIIGAWVLFNEKALERRKPLSWGTTNSAEVAFALT
jgi:hypothetical protein